MSKKFITIWSMDEKAWNEVAYKGTYLVTYKDSWGDTPDPIKVSNPTWLELREVADKLVRLSGDTHHIFIEGFDLRKPKNKIKELALATGS